MSRNTYTGVVSIAPRERDLVGMVIGRGGYGIKDVTTRSGARMITYNQPKSQFEISGTPNQVDRAEKIIRAKLVDCSHKKASRFTYTPGTTRVMAEPKKMTVVRVRASSPLSNGFSALAKLEGKQFEEVEREKEEKAKKFAEARAREEKEVEESWMKSVRARDALREAKNKADQRKARIEELEARMAKAEEERKARETSYGGVAYVKKELGDEVLGGFGGAAKAKKSKNKSQSSRGISITAEILPSRTVNMRELREHNNRIFRKEKAQREAKKAAWEERNAKKVKVPEAEVTRERSPSPAPSLDSIPEEGSRKRARESEEDDEWSPSPSPVSYGLPDDTHYRNSQPLKRINTEDEEMGRLTPEDQANIEEYLNSLEIGYCA